MLDCDVRRRILKDFKDEHNHADNCYKSGMSAFRKQLISSFTWTKELANELSK